MELLLADDDFNFLVRQPGFESSIGKKLRQDRVRIFRQYLHRLIADFNRLHVYARYLISQGAEDQSALVMRLVWLRVRFSATVMRLELSLFLRISVSAKTGQPRDCTVGRDEHLSVLTLCRLTLSAHQGSANFGSCLILHR